MFKNIKNESDITNQIRENLYFFTNHTISIKQNIIIIYKKIMLWLPVKFDYFNISSKEKKKQSLYIFMFKCNKNKLNADKQNKI